MRLFWGTNEDFGHEFKVPLYYYYFFIIIIDYWYHNWKMRNIILQTLKLLVSNGSTFWPQKSFIILFNEKYFFLPCLRKTQFRFEFGSIRKLCFEIWIDFCNETWLINLALKSVADWKPSGICHMIFKVQMPSRFQIEISNESFFLDCWAGTWDYSVILYASIFCKIQTAQFYYIYSRNLTYIQFSY